MRRARKKRLERVDIKFPDSFEVNGQMLEGATKNNDNVEMLLQFEVPIKKTPTILKELASLQDSPLRLHYKYKRRDYEQTGYVRYIHVDHTEKGPARLTAVVLVPRDYEDINKSRLSEKLKIFYSIIKVLLLNNYMALALFIAGLMFYLYEYHKLSIVFTSLSILLGSIAFFYITFYLEYSDQALRAILTRKFIVKALPSALHEYLYDVIIKKDLTAKEKFSLDGALTLARRFIFTHLISCWFGSALAYAIIFHNFSYIWGDSFLKTSKNVYVTQFPDLLYFSFSTITTLGYSDIILVGSQIIRFFCISESILGVFLIGLGIAYLFLAWHRFKAIANGIINVSYDYFDKYDGNKTLLKQTVIDYHGTKGDRESEEKLGYELKKYTEYVKKKLPQFGLVGSIKRFLGLQ